MYNDYHYKSVKITTPPELAALQTSGLMYQSGLSAKQQSNSNTDDSITIPYTTNVSLAQIEKILWEIKEEGVPIKANEYQMRIYSRKSEDVLELRVAGGDMTNFGVGEIDKKVEQAQEIIAQKMRNLLHIAPKILVVSPCDVYTMKTKKIVDLRTAEYLNQRYGRESR